MNNFYKENAPWELLTNQLSGIATAQEEQALNQWLGENPENLAFWEDLQALWTQTAGYRQAAVEAEQLDQALAWKNIQQRIAKHPQMKVVHKKNGWQRYGRGIVAAAVLLAVTTFAIYIVVPQFMSANEMAEVQWRTLENELDAPKTVQMPDGSSIVLNQGSQLSYPEKFDERKVKLQGEAFFEVTKDAERPFTVHFGKDASVQVLGTSFNVQAFEGSDEYRVAVVSGKVKFQADPANSLELNAGDAASYHQPKAELLAIKDPNALFWKTGKLEYDGTPLKQVLADLETHLGVRMRVRQKNLFNCEFVGMYEGDLDKFFKALEFTTGLTIEQEGEEYFLAGEGCEE